jgi:hypothetical protein
MDDRPLRQLCAYVDVARPACTRELDEQLGRELRCLLGEIRVDALLPAVRALRAQAQPHGRAVDRERLEVRRLEQHLGRLLVDLALEPTHDPGDRHRMLRVGDDEVALVQVTQRVVERA